MAAKEQLPLSFRIADFFQSRGYRVGALTTDENADYKASIRTLAVWSKAVFIFKPARGIKGWFSEPPCIAALIFSDKDWYLQIYGRQYQEEMEAMSALLGKEFHVQTYSKVLAEKPRNY